MIVFFILHFHEQANSRDVFKTLREQILPEDLENQDYLKKEIMGIYKSGRNPYSLLEEPTRKFKQKPKTSIKSVLDEKAEEFKVSNSVASTEFLKTIYEKLVWKYTKGT